MTSGYEGVMTIIRKASAVAAVASLGAFRVKAGRVLMPEKTISQLTQR